MSADLGDAPREECVLIGSERLHAFVARILLALEVGPGAADTVARVLVDADLRGIDSHGVGNLWRYVKGLREGWINAQPNYRLTADVPAGMSVDADRGLGHVVAVWAMERAIERAANVGVGVVAVSNSNHFGIAGYYARLALRRDMIGIALTNSQALVAPTFGREAMLGTNPIAVAAPSESGAAFVLDMATSVAAQGRVAVKGRLGEPIPNGWAVDGSGHLTVDTRQVLTDLARGVGALLPLGGLGEQHGGHKGYGLALAVDILSGVLAGAGYADATHLGSDEEAVRTNIGHLLVALDIGAFRPVVAFKRDMSDLLRRIRDSKRLDGRPRIFIHGEKESEEKQRRLRMGIPLHRQVVEDLEQIASILGLDDRLVAVTG